MKSGRPFSDADRDLVRALWADGTPSLADLEDLATRLGRTVGSIKNMAHYLGASSDGRKRQKRAAAEPKVELACLKCQKRFLSENRATNRVCNHCKSRKDWRAGGDMGVQL